MAAGVRLLLVLILISLFHLSLSLSESEALLKLKASLNHTGSLDNWDPNTDPCVSKWNGLICNNGIVMGLHLTQMGLWGYVDIDAIKQLQCVRTISLMNNSFTGSIPQFNRIGNLRAMYLSGNEFSGRISSGYFSNMTSLKKVWLDNNNFTGSIPESLTKLPNLIELHLENNQLSGTIPAFKYNAANPLDLDLSNNKLEGEIPQSLIGFESKAFQGNAGLCGKAIQRNCTSHSPRPPPLQPFPPPPSAEEGKKRLTTGQWIGISVGIIVPVVLIAFIILIVIKKRRENADDFDVLIKSQQDDVVEVQVSRSAAPPTAKVRSSSSSSRQGGSTKHGSITSKHGSTHSKSASRRGGGGGELVMINDYKGMFGLPELMKAAAEVLGNGGLGSAYKALIANGVTVVVKRMREMNRLGKDGFDAEIAILGKLKHPNILTPLAYHFRKEEKLLISEFVPKGSLLYVLHGDRGTHFAELHWPTRLKIIRGIVNGLDYLHSVFDQSDLPHGNLKSSNVLLGSDYEPLLNDYAFYPLVNTSQATQALFALRTPEYSQHQLVSPKSDIYCLGVIILEIITGKFPSQYLSNGNGGIDVVQWVRSSISEKREVELMDPGMANDSPDSLGKMEKLLHIGALCTDNNPDQRPDIKGVISLMNEIQA